MSSETAKQSLASRACLFLIHISSRGLSPRAWYLRKQPMEVRDGRADLDAWKPVAWSTVIDNRTDVGTVAKMNEGRNRRRVGWRDDRGPTDGRRKRQMCGTEYFSDGQKKRTDGRTGGRKDERTDERTNGRLDRRIDEQTDGRTDEHTDEQTSGRTDVERVLPLARRRSTVARTSSVAGVPVDPVDKSRRLPERSVGTRV